MKADFQTQVDFEELYNKNQLMDRLRREFNIPDVIAQCEKHEIPLNFGVDLLVHMVIHKRATVSVLVGQMYKMFKKESNPLQACADMLLKAAQADFMDWSSLDETFILRIDVSSDVYEDLERYQYPLPLLIEPNEVTHNKQSGYHTMQSSMLLKNSHHDDDICLDHINRVNLTRFRLNNEVINMIANSWRNLDKQKPGEYIQDFKRRVKAFEKYDRSCKDIFDHLNMWGNEFYLTHKYDKRGRCYSQGYHVNPQGNAWNKASIEFAHQEIIN